MHIAFVVARARNGVIGCDGELPWRLPSELRHFRSITSGKPIIMGRNTWESLPKKPLPHRLNIVLSFERSFVADGATVCHSPAEALAVAKSFCDTRGIEEVCVIGGQSVFEAMWQYADRVYETEVQADVQGDTFFHIIDADFWENTSRTEPVQQDGDEFSYVVRTHTRKACPVRNAAA
ncbi:MAG: dihydrofolate reductase [Oceanicaulis sp.]|nr:dihydrofolate reductase [Oceanicaulis sp.]